MTRSRGAVPTPTTGYAYLDVPGPVLAFAHRGGAARPDLVGLENTTAAFAAAYALGFRYLETDVHVTADGHLVAFHDPDLHRVTGTAGAVADLDLAAVRRARVAGREPIPLLADLFDAFPEARFNIDLKSERAAEVLAAFLEERDAWDRVLVGSFSARRARRFRHLAAGRVPGSAHPLEIVAFLLLPGRLAGRLVPGAHALQVPHRRRGLLVASARLVRRAHRAGRHVHVWTIDDPAEMEVLLDRGVDGLMTDRPDILRDVLVRRGRWSGPGPTDRPIDGPTDGPTDGAGR